MFEHTAVTVLNELQVTLEKTNLNCASKNKN